MPPNPVCKDMDKGWIKVWYIHKMEQTATEINEEENPSQLYVLTWDNSQTRLREEKKTKKRMEPKEGNKRLLSV